MFFSSISYFTNTPNVEYSWQIQDDNNKNIASNISGKSLRYKFDKIGNYIVTLTARNPNGETDKDSRQVTIESRPPIVNLDTPKVLSSETPNIITFDASKSYDPDTMGRK
jgi:PKD repeat protein